MATLWRAWRVVARRRGRPFADGLTVPSPAATEAAAEARVARARAEAVKTNVSHAGYVTGSRVLGHHRGAPTMTYAVELHVTPDIIAHPPGGACDVVVGVCDGDGTRDAASVTRWETDAYDFAVTVPCPAAAASARERHAGLVAAYTSALDAAWGIGATHFVDTDEPRFEEERTKQTFASSPPRGVAVPLLPARAAAASNADAADVAASARAAAEAVSAYNPPPHIAEWSHEAESPPGGEETRRQTSEPVFAVRFAAPSDAAATALERELETHLGQHYVAVPRTAKSRPRR